MTDNFIITHMDAVTPIQPQMACSFLQITEENCHRVRDFRDERRLGEFRAKLARNELGFFAAAATGMVGSIWATVNASSGPVVVRTYMTLRRGEALVHDVVASERTRGSGVGPFMVRMLASELLVRQGASKVIVDVNARNRPSLRMMAKLGVEPTERVLYVSAFGRPVLTKVVRAYQPRRGILRDGVSA